MVVTVQDPNLGEWILEVGKSDSECFTPIASGRGELVEELAGHLDTTLMPNGMYDLRLTAYDANQQGTRHTVTLFIQGEFKVGRFTTGFRDLEIPLRGIPIQVNRFYDSTDKCPGDFGYGWNLAEPDIRANITPGRLWNLDEQAFCVTANGGYKYPPYSSCSGVELPLYCIDDRVEHYVTVTLPGGKTEIFDLEMDVDGGVSEEHMCLEINFPESATPLFLPREGNTSTLKALSPTIYFRQIQAPNGETEWQMVDTNFEPWNPQRYELTTSDGIVYVVHVENGLESITDLEGNTVTYSETGIEHTAGVRVEYTRDAMNRITSVTDPDGGVIRYEYDTAGDLIAVTDRMGYVTGYRYDDFHNLIETTDPNGDIPGKFYYDEDGRLIAQEDAYGNRINYDHDIQGRQEIVTDRHGNSTVYVYDNRGNIHQVTNALGNTTSYTYDDNGNETSQTLALGTSLEATTHRTYDGKGNLLTETNPLGQTVILSYDNVDNPLTQTDANDNTTHFTYDSASRPTQIQDAFGGIYTSRYTITGTHLVIQTTNPEGFSTIREQNAQGQVIREVDGRGVSTTFTHDNRGNILRESRNGSVWQRFYDANDKLVREVDALGNQTHTEYNANQQVTAVIDALGNRTKTVYDVRGKAVRVVYPDGNLMITTYDSEGRRFLETDRLGRITRFEYDGIGQLVRTIYPDGSTIEQSYDAAGRVDVNTDQRDYQSTTVFDLAGNIMTSIDALGHQTDYAYNNAGALTELTDAKGQVTRIEYNGKGQQTATVFHDGTHIEYGYDAWGRKTGETDQLGRLTQFAYDGEDNLTRVIDTMGGVTRYEYGSNSAASWISHRTAQIDSLGRRTQWVYDELGNEISRILPMGRVETKAYDAASQLSSRTDFNGETTTYSYNPNGQETGRFYADGSSVQTTHTATGKRATVTDDRGVTTYAYDLMDRPVRVINPDGSWIGYEYDMAFNRTAVLTANGRADFTYDGLNRLTRVVANGGETTLSYDEVGNRSSVIYPNNTEAHYYYDELNRITRLENVRSDGSVISSYTYTLDALGQRIAVDEASGRHIDYSYDDLNRLVGETIQDMVNGNQSYIYDLDEVGNRRSVNVNGTVTNSTYDANDRLLTKGGTSYVYDANGNTLSRDDAGFLSLYTYNPAGLLIRATTPTGEMTYAYDSDGIRVEVGSGDQKTRYLVDHNRAYAQVLEETDEQGLLQASYLYGDDLISLDRNGSTSFYHYDGHGTTTALTNAAGQVTDRYQYESFGNLVAETGSTENAYLYAGEQFDTDLSLYYLRARYYNQGTGRFHSMDSWTGSIEEPVTLHKYLYANGAPPVLVDPSGYFATLTSINTAQAGFATLAAVSTTSLFYFIATADHAFGFPLLMSKIREKLRIIPYTIAKRKPRPLDSFDLHHTIPVYMGASKFQRLVQMTLRDHKLLHTQLASDASRVNEILGTEFKRHLAVLSIGNKEPLRILSESRLGRVEIVRHLSRFYLTKGWLHSRNYIPIFSNTFSYESIAFLNGKPEYTRGR